jgi:hypothetical protein
MLHKCIDFYFGVLFCGLGFSMTSVNLLHTRIIFIVYGVLKYYHVFLYDFDLTWNKMLQ